ncbi:conserved Plasmodium protein, unknown function [Plasmodium knowlesi strain H]|uniref:RNA polymerase II subunit B1 CTD phosphatase RPAP2 homolog n=3 Tax=Plasmodium knowlesi TaxID=5850 RepID=A0A5K1UN44_PLAKH|nr:RTR1 domain-containing protein, putative [Plasmodium knowlesi strain H]OTN66862.1 Uncharacterized protein PKNOH_S08502200 [Plasmodium knowlesi]CAA9986709.1 RTR1 domain-containing protein, putative [Plasmodium knowlesi strain H]SBO23523.1 conserved Plasmodium protein, unknown function [Plasmodium knowlesi strain H]SBO25026.1 conserved Plasmodium protein, unknown function [Plasmodium knowlesi strain H]VVS76183.1 RTR1 domain-containing protein, putative [Plasmodium knowlesi strain H]|eukprot:XP_002257894.1 hypothetical protein, conserved in Plasmodium species [Plasmodium knowlesi strain H]
MNAQIRKKRNLLQGEAKLNSLARIFHRKLETLLIYIRVPKKKQGKLFFDDFFNVEEVSAFINTLVDDEQHGDGGHGDHQADRSCSGESLNLNADNEIKTSKDIFIKNLLIFLNNLIVLYFSKSNLIDVCINRRSFNKCGFYACDNLFLNTPKRGKYKIDAESRNIYLREYYDLFCSASCMNYNLHLLKEIAKNGNNAKGGKGGGTNLKTKCQLIYIMFLTFFPIFKFHDINVLLNNLEHVYIQNNQIFLKPGGGGKVEMNGRDKEDSGHTDGKEATNGGDKVYTIRTGKDKVNRGTNELGKTLFPIIVEKKEGFEDSEDKITEEFPEGNASNKNAISTHVMSNHEQEAETNKPGRDGIITLPLEESLGGYGQVKKEENPTSGKVDSCPKGEEAKSSKSKNVRFNKDVQLYEYMRDERVDVYSVLGSSMGANQVGRSFQVDGSPPSRDILYEDSLSGTDKPRREVHASVPSEQNDNTIIEGPGGDKSERSVTLQRPSNEKMEGTMSGEGVSEGKTSDDEMTEVYEQVRQSIFTNRKHFFDDILGKTLFDPNKVIGFDYEGKDNRQDNRQDNRHEWKNEMVKDEGKQVGQTEEKGTEQVEDEKTKRDLRVCAAQRMSEINLKHDRERKGRRIILLSSPIFEGTIRGNPQTKEDEGASGNDKIKDMDMDDMDDMGDVMEEEKREDAAAGDDEKEDGTVPLDGKEDDTVPVDGKNNDNAAADGENEDTSSYDDKDATASGEGNTPAVDTEEDKEELENLLIKKKEKIGEQYDMAFNRCMPLSLLAEEDGESKGENWTEDHLKEEDKSSDDEEQVKRGQNKYTYSTDKCSAYENMSSLYVVLWDILTGIISKYTVYYFRRSEFIIPKCPTEEERDRKNEFMRNISQNMPQSIHHSIAPIVLNVCQTFFFNKPLLPFKKIIYESIIYVIAAALGRHKVELIPSEEMENIQKTENFFTLENGMDKEELDELTMLFYQHLYY